MESKIGKKDNTNCCVPQCKSKGSNTPNVSFHKFPAIKSEIRKTTSDGRNIIANRRKEWIRILKIGKEVPNRMTVCSTHFDDNAFTFPPEKCQRPRLKSSALPTLCLPKTSTYSKEKTSLKEVESSKRLARYEEIKRKRLSHTVLEPAASTSQMPGATVQEHLSDVDIRQDTLLSNSSNSEIIAIDVLLGFQHLPDKQNKSVQVCSGDLKSQHIIKADDLTDCQLKSLTGLTISILNYLAGVAKGELNITNKHQLPIKERILLAMMKMYLNISFSSLAIFFFGCTVKTASNIFFSTIPVLSSILGLFIEWPTKEEVLVKRPNVFQAFKDVRVVLDCTEILIQKPKCLTERINTYSHYYKDHTTKYMIGVSPSGLITFVSKGYGGKASDQHIFMESNIIEMLEPHLDAIMVDKGFLIDEICEKNFIKLVRPPFLKKKKNQFSAAEAKLVKKIASARVHVERVIQRIKIFRIFASRVTYKLLNIIDHMIIIAAGLTNLGAPVLSDEKFPQ